jgi:glycosyltransferase involved in cell wall biosynthesis
VREISHLTILTGHTQEPTCGVADYCKFLRRAFGGLGFNVEAVQIDWAKRGWPAAALRLWRQSVGWRDRWVLLQYTAGMWSRYGFPLGVLVVAFLLRLRRVRLAVTFHEPYSWEVPPSDWLDRIRAICQQWVIYRLYRCTSKAIFADPLETVSWLTGSRQKPVFIPIGGNIPEPAASVRSEAGSLNAAYKTVSVFCLSDPPRRQKELEEIARALLIASKDVPKLRLTLLGKGTTEAKDQIDQLFAGTSVEVLNMGIRSAEEVSEILAKSDAMLCVRGQLFPRRGSALAGIACGVPIIAYAGPAQRTPIAEAGVQFVHHGEPDALGAALTRLLIDDRLRAELRARNRRGYEKFFSWNRIALRHVDALGLGNRVAVKAEQ